jgi:sRNA-binding carbon storage regulator CsrA
VRLVESLGGDRAMLAEISDRITVKYVRAETMKSGRQEAVVGLQAPRHVEIVRTELLARRAS